MHATDLPAPPTERASARGSDDPWLEGPETQKLPPVRSHRLPPITANAKTQIIPVLQSAAPPASGKTQTMPALETQPEVPPVAPVTENLPGEETWDFPVAMELGVAADDGPADD